MMRDAGAKRRRSQLQIQPRPPLTIFPALIATQAPRFSSRVSQTGSTIASQPRWGLYNPICIKRNVEYDVWFRTLLIQELTSVTLKKRGGTNHYQQTADPEGNSTQPYDGIHVMGTKQ